MGLATLAQSERYSYARLQGHHSIRLITVQPVSEEHPEQIHCSMNTLSLDETPFYHALSYTWGNAIETKDDPTGGYSRTCDVWIASKKVQVTRNLYDALIQIRSFDKCQWWVDMICINQEDLEERSQQVALMGKIYSQATKVVAWLGTPDKAAREAVEIVNALSSVPDESDRICFKLYISQDEDPLERHGFPRVSVEKWFSLRSFFDRTWFSRFWIIQEAALATLVEFWCGELLITHSALSKAQKNLVGSSMLRSLSEIGSTLYPTAESRLGIGSHVNTILLLRALCDPYDTQSATNITRLFLRVTSAEPNAGDLLCRILQFTSIFHSTDSRDRIFAILPMVKRIFSLCGCSPLSVIVDYTFPTTAVYHRTARTILVASKNLNLLSYQPDTSSLNVAGLPSWVLDFSKRTGVSLTQVDYNQHTPHFNASHGYHSMLPSFTVKDALLECRGYCLDVVEDLGEELGDLTGGGRFEESARLMLKQKAIYVTGQGRIESLWRTLILDSVVDQHPAPLAFAASFRGWLKTVLCRFRAPMYSTPQEVQAQMELMPSIDLLAKSETDSIIPTLVEVVEQSKILNELLLVNLAAFREHIRTCVHEFSAFHLAVTVPANGRRLFRTHNGYLGLGPKSLQVGDTIWILPDALVPMAFRKAHSNLANRYRLVGEAYVHGIMHGEAFENMEPTWESIVLE